MRSVVNVIKFVCLECCAHVVGFGLVLNDGVYRPGISSPYFDIVCHPDQTRWTRRVSRKGWISVKSRRGGLTRSAGGKLLGLDIRLEETACKSSLSLRRGVPGPKLMIGDCFDSVQAAHAHPDLFDSLVLIDPMTRALEEWERLASFPGGHPLIVSCIGRRETWPSREEARAGLIKSPYFQAWDKGVFDSFIEYGLVEVDRLRTQGGKGEGVTLTTPRWAEAQMFAASRGMFDGYDKLAKLRKDMKVTFAMAEDSNS